MAPKTSAAKSVRGAAGSDKKPAAKARPVGGTDRVPIDSAAGGGKKKIRAPTEAAMGKKKGGTKKGG